MISKITQIIKKTNTVKEKKNFYSCTQWTNPVEVFGTTTLHSPPRAGIQTTVQ